MRGLLIKWALVPILLALTFVYAQTGGQETGGQGGAEPISERLVLRLFSQPEFPKGNVTDIIAGALPDTWPETIPLPEDAEVVGSVRYAQLGVQVVLDAQQSPPEVLEFYRNELEDWREARFPGREGGFIESEARQSVSFCNGEAEQALQVGAFQRGTSTDVRLGLSEIGRYSICDEDEGERPRFRGDDLPVPALSTPTGAQLSSSGLGTDEDGAIARALLETSRTPEALVSDYAEQLPAQGWQLGVRNQEGAQAWHTFSLSNEEGDWQGYLVAIDLPEEQVQLFFSVAPEVTGGVD